MSHWPYTEAPPEDYDHLEGVIPVEGSVEVPCLGGCGRSQPDLQDNKWGQRCRVGDWVCGACAHRLGRDEVFRLLGLVEED